MALKRNLTASPLVYDWTKPAVWPNEVVEIYDAIAAGLSASDWGDVVVESVAASHPKANKTATPAPEPEAPAVEETAPETEVPAAPDDNASEEDK